LPVNVIVTVGHGADPDRFGPQPPNVRITDYLPQADLLPHCRLVVSHGGAGTVLGALCHAIPRRFARAAQRIQRGIETMPSADRVLAAPLHDVPIR
jgi:Erythromycin biosynthesis protein CIII-like, C-terminal domain